MSDMNRPPAQKGYMGAAGDPLRKNMSFMNPMDLATMKQEGQFTEDMTVNDALMKVGIDPNGPVSQLVEFGQKQIQNADMAGKMQNIAGDAGTEEPAQGLEGLLRR
jgi:hypothetical protein